MPVWYVIWPCSFIYVSVTSQWLMISSQKTQCHNSEGRRTGLCVRQVNDHKVANTGEHQKPGAFVYIVVIKWNITRVYFCMALNDVNLCRMLLVH